ncbi:MAG TPA: glycerophosphodiester phosphodiesterase family protein [Chloroflexota bacterium]
MRRRHVVRAAAAVLVLAIIYLFGYEPPYRGTLVVGAPQPLVFAHRGFGDHGPDNSLLAVEHAFDVDMDGVDVDGQLTKDGELVIFHDLSVDRLTSGTGRVRDKTLKEMLALDLGPKYQAGTTGAYVHTFEDFVRAVKGRGTLMVELKVPGLASTGIEQRAVEIIQKYDAHLSVVLSSFNPLVLYRVKRLDPFVRTALIFMDTNWNPQLRAEIKEGDLVSLPWVLRQEFIRRALRKIVRPDLLSINHEVDEAVIDRLIAKGWPAFIWTPDNESDIRRALAKKPYGVISDRPILAKQLRDR